jgi:hypothetical protein
MRATRRPRDVGGDIRAWMRPQSNSHSTTSSRQVPSSPMRYLGVYGELAARHMARWQPSTYAAIPVAEREAYFLELDDEVAQAIRDRETSLTPPQSLAETDHQKYVGQINMAHLMAEEEVLKAMVYLPPEPGLESEEDEPETDESGAFIDRDWNNPRLEMTDEEWAEKRAEGDWKPLPTQRAEPNRSSDPQ